MTLLGTAVVVLALQTSQQISKASIEGFVVRLGTSEPLPRTANIMLLPRSGVLGAGGFLMGLNSYNAGSGTFELRDVAPGSYWLNVQSIEPPANAGIASVRNSAQIPVDVSKADIDVVVAFSPGITIPGRISVEGGTPFSSLPDYDRIRPFLSSVAEGGFSTSLTTVAADGTFKVENVQPGDYRLIMAPITSLNMYVKEARLGQSDVLGGFSITGPVSGALEIVLSPNGAQIDGTIVDKDRTPMRGIQAVLIPDRQRDRRDLYRTATTDQNGQFVMRTVVPGEYKVFAWEDLEPFAYNDPDILRKYEDRGVTIKVSESARLMVEAKIIPAGQ
jgi:hypothetical protein